MRTCLFNDSFPPQVDGVANTVLNYASILQKSKGDTLVCVPEYPDITDHYPFSVQRYPSLDFTKRLGYRAGIPFDVKTFETIQQFQPEIYHSHCPCASTLLARSIRHEIPAPLVMTYHTKFDIDIRRTMRGKLLQEEAIASLVENISSCDEVWVVSKGAGENLCSLGYQKDYIVMENGVDLPLGKVSETEMDALRKTYHLPTDGRPIFLFVGRMVWYKGMRISLDALQKLRQEGKDFLFVLIGDGSDTQEIKDYIKALGLEDVCLFTGVLQNREELRGWYSLSSLFLFPSTFDTNGLVVREAAACSLPCVVIKNSCASEGITHGETGLLIEETPDDMAGILRQYGWDAPTLQKIGEMASQKIYVSWEESIERAAKRYEVVIDNYRRGLYPKHIAPLEETFADLGQLMAILEEARQKRLSLQAAIRQRVEYAHYIPRQFQQNMEANRKELQEALQGQWNTISEEVRNILDEIDRYL